MTSKLRVVFDTNVIVSAVLLPRSVPRQAFDRAQEHGKVLISVATVDELNEVLHRQRFDKYVREDQRLEFLAVLIREAELVEVTEVVTECRDPWPDDVQKTFGELGESVYATMWGPSEFTATGSLRTYERAERLKELSLPVLFTTGRYDEAPPSTVEYYQGLVPGARLRIFERSAHLTMQDEPDAYVQAIRDFLREVEAR